MPHERSDNARVVRRERAFQRGYGNEAAAGGDAVASIRGHAAGAKPEECADFRHGKCRRGNSCKYLHVFDTDGACDEEELGLADEGQEECENFKRGRCKRGDSCKYLHVDDSRGASVDPPDAGGSELILRIKELKAELQAALSLRVKELKRSSKARQNRWHEVCDEFGGGIRDPSRHHHSFLEDFVDEVEEEEAVTVFNARSPPRPPLQAPPRPAPPLPPPPALPDDAPGHKNPLIFDLFSGSREVGAAEKGRGGKAKGKEKDGQVRGGKGKDGRGSRQRSRSRSPVPQPARKGTSRGKGKGEPEEGTSSTVGSVSDVKDRVKKLLSDPEVRAHWHSFCDRGGNQTRGANSFRTRDPNKLPGEFLQAFLDHIVALEEGGSLQQPEDAGSGNSFFLDHDALVRRMRKFIKGRGNRELWEKFCATYGKGLHDPDRHPASFLEDFLETHSDRSQRGAPVRDDAHTQLVLRVKGETRQKAMRDQWHAFCDERGEGVYNPARHSAEFLEEFLFNAGVDAEEANACFLPREGCGDSPEGEHDGDAFMDSLGDP